MRKPTLAQTEAAIAAAQVGLPATGRGRRRRSGTTSCCGSRRRSSPAATSLAGCWRAKRARPSRRPSAKSLGPGRSSTSSPARPCASPATNSPPSGRTSTSRRPASRSGWSESSRRGTSRSRSPPGRSRRRSPTATRSCSSPPTSSRARPMRSPRSSTAPAFRRASSIWSWAGASVVGEAMLTSKAVDAVSFTGSVATGRASPPPAPGRCASSSSRWAARTRWSCSPTPTRRPLSNAPSTAPSFRPASAARPRRA